MSNTFTSNHDQKPSLFVENFPSGKHAVITWKIPDNYGGMTKALLHRSESFVKYAGVNVDILTFDWRGSYEEVRSRLLDRGALVDGMKLINFWEELSSIRDDELNRIPNVSRPSADELIGTAQFNAAERAGVLHSEEHGDHEATGHPVRAFYREDGTLFLTISKVQGDRSSKARAIRLYRRDTTPVAEWSSIRDVYYSWLDFWCGQRDSYLIIDSKYMANIMLNYRRSQITTIYMVHGSHLQSNKSGPFGALSKTRGNSFQKAHRFDAVCVLTDRQRTHVLERFGDIGNLHVIPNGHEPRSSTDRIANRAPNHATMVAILSKRKRIDHAIRAIIDDHGNLPEDTTLDIFGTGEDEDKLQRLIDEFEGASAVRLRGFTNQPSGEFEKASFSLLTSTAEGFPLVLLEMMSVGCVPIAYDVNYGPSQIIDDEVNGYLVREENPDSLRSAISKFLALSEDSRYAMRKSAIERAGEFSDSTVVGKWKEVLLGSKYRKMSQINLPKFQIGGTFVTYTGDGGVRIGCDVEFDGVMFLPNFESYLYISAYSRSGEIYVRVPVASSDRAESVVRVAADFGRQLVGSAVPEYLDWYLEAITGEQQVRKRLPFSRSNANPAVYGTLHGNMSTKNW